MSLDPRARCPICGTSAVGTWVDGNAIFLFDCEQCSTFTITMERLAAFEEAWRVGDRDTLMCLEAISHYLRRAGDDGDRDITDASWMEFALDGQFGDDADHCGGAE